MVIWQKITTLDKMPTKQDLLLWRIDGATPETVRHEDHVSEDLWVKQDGSGDMLWFNNEIKAWYSHFSVLNKPCTGKCKSQIKCYNELGYHIVNNPPLIPL